MRERFEEQANSSFFIAILVNLVIGIISFAKTGNTSIVPERFLAESTQAKHLGPIIRQDESHSDPGQNERQGARRVVGHRDHLVNLQGVKHRVQFPLLLFGGVRVVRRLVRCSPAQKVEGDDLAITQIRDQAIVDVQIVGKAALR